MSKHVIDEAKRCLQCKNPRCKMGCPVSTPVNDMVKMLLEGDIIKAGEMLFENNPLSSVCSLVCPVEKFCEGNCILNHKNNPIQVSIIENYISEYYLRILNESPNINKDRKIAVIGSGPAGITISFMLARKGYDITIFEAHDKIGGVLRYGIPDYRLPKNILDLIKNKLLNMGVKIRPNTLIGPVITLEDLFRDGYKAIFIGTGVWNPKPLRIKGESLGHVHYAIDYLKNPNVYDLGQRVVIIGAGNTAIDAARTALRKGVREVIIMYRRGEEDMPANREEIEYAKIDGVKFEFFKSPLEILDEGIKYIKTEKSNNEKDRIVEIPGTEAILETDSIIIAASQGPKANIVSNTEGLKINNSGLLLTDNLGRTTKEGVFASGDVVTGARTVVEAVSLSKKVAEAIDQYVREKYPELF
ncbi:NAD(P)-dependent oxidoreductase [Caloramator sp. CAR-1]|uniref:NAD(P)-dependent oxidoreductase n=1 Tax=Caloramator sp. CAR-1 TaxID=3062777 RepID=UPI0026E2C4E0|nr:NAD(P)-dependent oxidoreductase [Caloramator sp. CAR-1]MDO6354217.1 NAD(P)-dependent oxidoreductase [Caloramator sp. CAR-1]